MSAAANSGITEITACCACGGNLETLLELPRLPLTGLYGETPPTAAALAQGFDQSLCYCPNCTHLQLGRFLDGGFLYDASYGFRTAGSQTASAATRYFRDWLLTLLPAGRCDTIVEFGCNDTTLLQTLADVARQRIGIDPILAHTADLPADITTLAVGIEAVDLRRFGADGPDLILCQHTLEHMPDPDGLLRHLRGQVGNQTIFAFEFPCADLLVAQQRFDQVFHQHLQYFSCRSIAGLLERHGFELIDFTFNASHWGALLLAFRLGRGGCEPLRQRQPRLERARLDGAHELFCRQMRACAALLDATEPPLYGFGAGQMLPVLDYHLGGAARRCAAIIDDDRARQGQWYGNLPLAIQSSAGVDFPGSAFLITAVDSRRAIAARLATLGAGRIVSPFLSL